MKPLGKIEPSIRTELEDAGINQTLHKIYLDLDTSIGILTPFGSFGKELKNSVLLPHAVIVGKVPSTYYHFDKEIVDEDMALETMQ